MAGRWLLEIDTGARIRRYADLPCEVPDGADTLRYTGGLTPPSTTVEADTASVQVVDPDAPWVRSPGPLVGRRASLLWWTGGDIRYAQVAVRGTLTVATWGSPDTPDRLDATIVRATSTSSRVWPPRAARVRASTWPARGGGWVTAETTRGAYYPTVLGGPGQQPADGEGRYGATPALLVEYQAADTGSRLLIADGHVAATVVRIYDVRTGDNDACTLILTEDAQGRPVSMVDFSTAASIAPDPEGEYWASWPVGGGARLDGRDVVGLGDLLAWGARTLDPATHDLVRLEVWRTALNRYQIGTCWNEPQTWEDYVQGAVLGVFPIDVREGPRGRWYEPRRWRGRPEEAVAHLTTGRDITRDSALSEENASPANVIRVDYGPAEAGARYTGALALGYAADAATVYDRECALSYQLYQEERAIDIAADLAPDAATALLIAQALADEHALPGITVTYQGGPELAQRIARGDVVRLTDLPDLDDRIGIVREVAPSETSTALVVYVRRGRRTPPTVARAVAGALPAAWRQGLTDDALASTAAVSATPTAPWTWLGAVRITGEAGVIFDWAYYSTGAAGTQSGWKVQYNGTDTIALNIFDASSVGVSFNRSDATEPDLSDTAELIMMAVHLSASGDVVFRAVIGTGLEDGPSTTNGIGSTSPEVERIRELTDTTGALSWAIVAGEVSDADFLALPRTFAAPRDYAQAHGYVLGRSFAGVDGDLLEVADIQMQGSDATLYPLAIVAGAGDLVKVSALS